MQFGEDKSETAADKQEGRWEVTFKARGADANGRKLTVTCGDEKITMQNIVIGDIWVLTVWGSLSGVAMVTIIMSAVGMLTGWVVLQPMVRLSLRRTTGVLRYWFSPAYVRMQLSKSGRGTGSDA